MNGPIAVLFDIDETLVHTSGAGARSWVWAFDRLHDIPPDIDAHTSAGETDPQVGRKTFQAVLDRDPSFDEMACLAELTEMGIAKATRLHGHPLAPEQVYVMGDTPLHIEAAHAAGATARGVASGHYSLDQLREAKPEHALSSLTEPFPGLAS